MDLRDSFSRLKKNLKHPLTRTRRKPDKTGTDAGGERVDPADSLPQSVSHVVAGSSHGEGNKATLDGLQVYLTDRPPQPDQPELEQTSGSESDQGGGEAGVDGRGVGQKGLHSHSDVEVAVEGRAGREGDGADAEKVERVHLSTPSVLNSREPDSMCQMWFHYCL